MRTSILSILAFLTLAFSIASCSSEKKVDPKVNYRDTIYVAITPTMDCLPLIVAKETGVADSRKHLIVLQYHMSKADCDTALAGGSVSAIFTDYGRAENLRANWTKRVLEMRDLRAKKNPSKDKKAKKDNKVKFDTLSIFPHDNLHLYLFTNYKARLNEAKQLKDKMIAADRNSAEADFAQHVLDSVRLSGDKTFIVNVLSYRVRKEMLLSNIMDAVVFPDPYATMARKAGHKSIYSSGHQKGKPFGCMVATRNADVIKHIYNLGCHVINASGIHKYDSLMMKRLLVPQDIVSSIPKHHFTPIK